MAIRFKTLIIITGCILFTGWHPPLAAEEHGSDTQTTMTEQHVKHETSSKTGVAASALNEATATQKKGSGQSSQDPAKTAPDVKDNQIHWYSYDDGIEKMQNENKKGYLHFYTDWCAYCKLMNRQTFSDADVIRYMNANFIPIRINAEKEKKVAQKYGVYRFPANWFLTENAEDILNQPGFIPANILVQILEYINTDSYQSMKFQDYLDKKDKQKEEMQEAANAPTEK
jgi:thioredoxin-related protein